jgi:hypothetical protein
VTASAVDVLHEDSNRRLLEMLPPEQTDRVFSFAMCDIGPEFLGFVGIYERLSQIIPVDWTVIDLGCAYAPQAFFFEKHREYIGVDLLTELEARFAARNSRHYHMAVSEFVERHTGEYRQDTTFAICSYVPPWGGDNMSLARGAFKNVFTFYPASSEPAIRLGLLSSVQEREGR